MSFVLFLSVFSGVDLPKQDTIRKKIAIDLLTRCEQQKQHHERRRESAARRRQRGREPCGVLLKAEASTQWQMHYGLRRAPSQWRQAISKKI
jgi:hypothetical protein